jgi:hypothetical protein
MKAAAIKDEFNRSGPVLHLLLRYTQALITQMAQTAVCNRHHTLDQQLCRWLLLSMDRLQGNELVMTQELIANMLGVRREGVTEGALKSSSCRGPGSSATRAATSRCSTARAWSDALASAMRSSRRNTTASCRIGQQLSCSCPGAMFKIGSVAALALMTLVEAHAELLPLIRQYIRETGSSTPVLVCVYGTQGQEVERTYPLGNFCPRYAET